MAYSDRAGKTKKASKSFLSGVEELREGRALEEHQNSNLEVGDFLSELHAVMRHKVRNGLHEGDWVEDPVRIYFDGGVFAEQVKKSSDIKLQVALCIDVSKSTYTNGVAAKIGAAIVGIDKTIRKAAAELPEGALTYKVFAFNRNTYRVSDDQVIENFDLRSKSVDKTTKEVKIQEDVTIKWGTYTILALNPRVKQEDDGWEQVVLKSGATAYRQSGLTRDAVNALIRQCNQLGVVCKAAYEDNWSETLVTPLFTAIEEWEREDGDHSAYRIDIILTDGEWDNKADIIEASKVQERRNGHLTTFMLNFLPRKLWGLHALPERCYQYEANGEFLGQQIRQIISDSLLDLA